MKNTLSLNEAQKAVLISQGIFDGQIKDSDDQGLSKAIEAIGYVQIDSISVVERAHHHTLWNRVEGYQPNHIELALKDKKIFEYWSHAAAYLPMSAYRFSLPRKKAIADGDTHWYRNVDKKLMASIVERIRQEGPLQAKDFNQVRHKNSGWWDWKPAKVALEQLYMQGELMVLRREKFQKVYELTERVVPSTIDTRFPTAEEYYRHLIQSYLSANALGTAEQMSYLLKGIKKPLSLCCSEMLENGELIKLIVDHQEYYALPTVDKLLTAKCDIAGVKILSPFDNLVIQRKRTKALFDFDYQIECYVPAAKRRVGYFSLPLLWEGAFAGRVDAKMDRKTGVLCLQHLYLETADKDEFITSLKPALEAYLAFNQGHSIKVDKITHPLKKLSAATRKQIAKSLKV